MKRVVAFHAREIPDAEVSGSGNGRSLNRDAVRPLLDHVSQTAGGAPPEHAAKVAAFEGVHELRLAHA